jgi:hypothetical protein
MIKTIKNWFKPYYQVIPYVVWINPYSTTGRKREEPYNKFFHKYETTQWSKTKFTIHKRRLWWYIQTIEYDMENDSPNVLEFLEKRKINRMIKRSALEENNVESWGTALEIQNTLARNNI